MRRALSVLGVLLISIAAGALMAAQDSGNVYGHVADEGGVGLPGVVATLTGPTIRPLVTTTDARGDFRFLGLAPASYTATIEMSGFTKVIRQNVIVTLGKNTEFTVSMKLSPRQETMTVTSATPLIDTRKTETGATFAQEELQQVPTSRDVWVVMQQVPGVQVNRINVAGNQSGSQADFVGKGSYQSTYIYDGVNVTDNGSNGTSAQYFDFDAFQEVQIATGGSDLSLNTGGVTINMITKRGTNEWKGSGRFFYAPNQLQSDNTSSEIAAIPSFQTNETRFIREYGVEVGGPILKDRAWIWAGASRQDINLDQTGQTDFQGNPLVSLTTLENWNAKLNLQLTDHNSAEFLYNRNEKLVERPRRRDDAAPGDDLEPERADHRPENPGLTRLLSEPLRDRVLRLRRRALPPDSRRRPGQTGLLRQRRGGTPQQLPILHHQQSAAPREPAGVDVLQHRLDRPRAEVRVSVPPLRHAVRVGLAG